MLQAKLCVISIKVRMFGNDYALVTPAKRIYPIAMICRASFQADNTGQHNKSGALFCTTIYCAHPFCHTGACPIAIGRSGNSRRHVLSTMFEDEGRFVVLPNDMVLINCLPIPSKYSSAAISTIPEVYTAVQALLPGVVVCRCCWFRRRCGSHLVYRRLGLGRSMLMLCCGSVECSTAQYIPRLYSLVKLPTFNFRYLVLPVYFLK